MPVGIDSSVPDTFQQTSAPSVTANVNQAVNQTNQGLASSYSSEGETQARGLLNAPSNYNNGLSYGDAATTAAIKARYMPQQNQDRNALSIDTMKSADADHLRNLQVAGQAASQEVEQNKQKAILKWNIDQQNKKARGAILGTTLGIVGGVVGGVYGGPGGAMAGYAAGSGVGNAVGSSN